MSNQRKSEFVNGNFGIQSFCGGHGKISPKSWLMLKGWVCPEFLIQQTGWVPTVITHKLLTIGSSLMDHWKSERVAYWNGIQDFRSFSLSETQKFSSIQPLFCPETEFSSEVNLQNSVTPKPLSGHGYVTNG
jgi:hypothetical protein